MPSSQRLERRLVGGEVGGEAALVADRGREPAPRPGVCFSAWKTSVPIRRHSEKVSAPAGTTMNSWKSTELSAWAPPLRTFIIGTGISTGSPPP